MRPFRHDVALLVRDSAVILLVGSVAYSVLYRLHFGFYPW
jgi:hypothetical protein